MVHSSYYRIREHCQSRNCSQENSIYRTQTVYNTFKMGLLRPLKCIKHAIYTNEFRYSLAHTLQYVPFSLSDIKRNR